MIKNNRRFRRSPADGAKYSVLLFALLWLTLFSLRPVSYAEQDHAADPPLLLNEAVSAGEGADWVEVKNTSSESVSLQGYYLSDSKKNLKKYAFPEMTLAPGALLVITCTGSGEESAAQPAELCAPFSISAKGETLYLSDTAGTVLDTLPVREVPLNGSTGRMNGAGTDVFYFAVPTPGEENGRDGCREITAPPTASVPQGVYEDTDSLTVSLTGTGKIYYTLDGSVPTEESPLYEEPFFLTETSVIRAVCLEEGKLLSSVASFSYIINEHDTLPVVSLLCDPQEMFGYNGVYYADRINNAHTRADVSFFDTEGEGFQRLCDLELHGTATRKTYNKKSLELKFLGRYGGDLEYDLFRDGNVTSFRKLVLRGGNLSNLDLLKDSFTAKLLFDTAPDLFPLDSRYAVVYINGAYYGIYAWREAYCEEYFASHTGCSADGVQIDRSPLRSGEVYDVITQIGNKSMQSEENYASASELLDMQSLAKWYVLEAYFNNMGINANVRYVKLAPAEKWRMVLFDLDYSCTSSFDGQLGWNTVETSSQIGPACAHLKKNPEFRELMLEAVRELIAGGFTPERIPVYLENTIGEIPDADAQKDCARWESSFDKWISSGKTMLGYLSEERYNDWLRGLASITHADEETMKNIYPAYR